MSPSLKIALAVYREGQGNLFRYPTHSEHADGYIAFATFFNSRTFEGDVREFSYVKKVRTSQVIVTSFDIGINAFSLDGDLNRRLSDVLLVIENGARIICEPSSDVVNDGCLTEKPI